jgi:hypothetical protein
LRESVYRTYTVCYFVCFVFCQCVERRDLGHLDRALSRVLQGQASRLKRISVVAQASLRGGCGVLALGAIYVCVWATPCSAAAPHPLGPVFAGAAECPPKAASSRRRYVSDGGDAHNASGPTTSFGQRRRRQSESSPKVSLSGRDSVNNGSRRCKSLSTILKTREPRARQPPR